MKITLHRCQITRARDLMRDLSDNALRGRMVALQIKGEDAKRAIAQYSTAPATVLRMCRIDYALTRHILRERTA
jgi:hypothetical protein